MQNIYQERKYILAIAFSIVALIYMTRLFYIQVINDEYKLNAENQAFRHKVDHPVRGFIFDRNGKVLVYNSISYDLKVIPKQVKNIDTNDLCAILGINRDDFKRKMLKAIQKPNSPRIASVFEKQISPETYAALQERMYKFSGFFVESNSQRKYPMKIAAHLLGYIGEVDKRITDTSKYYKDGDNIGISGIEKGYEKLLRGKKGTKIVVVNVHNREMGSYMGGIRDTASVPGLGLTASIDADLQLYGEQLLQNKIGSVVAIDPGTGEILALVTSPTYDPNLMVGRERTRNYTLLSRDTLGVPLFNRALMAYYPPGSTFKLINALIGLQEGVLQPSSLYPCHRGYPVMGGKPGCHPHSSPLNLTQAIQHSCNSYFCYVFRSIVDQNKYRKTEEGYNNWREYVLSFGVGKKLNSDLPQELRGMVPTTKYYDKYFGKGSWKSSTIVSLSIGQGELGITPLQMANIMATIANRGFYYTPHCIQSVGDKKLVRPEFTIRHYTKVAPANFDIVIEGMYQVVEAGTARIARIPGIQVCGKTGTAQNPHGKDHSLFVGFAPKDHPKIAIAVMVENAGFGATWAAPIASLMMEKYLNDSISRPDLEKRMLEGDLIHAPKPKQ